MMEKQDENRKQQLEKAWLEIAALQREKEHVEDRGDMRLEEVRSLAVESYLRV